MRDTFPLPREHTMVNTFSRQRARAMRLTLSGLAVSKVVAYIM